MGQIMQIPRSTERISSLCNKIHIKIVLQYKLFTNAHCIIITKARRIPRRSFIFRSCIFSAPHKLLVSWLPFSLSETLCLQSSLCVRRCTALPWAQLYTTQMFV